MKVLSNSLGTGLDKLDEEPGRLSPPTPRKKAARSVTCVFREYTGKHTRFPTFTLVKVLSSLKQLEGF